MPVEASEKLTGRSAGLDDAALVSVEGMRLGDVLFDVVAENPGLMGCQQLRPKLHDTLTNIKSMSGQ
jgi:hypothetical protein